MKLQQCAATFFMAIAINSLAMETAGDIGAHSNALLGCVYSSDNISVCFLPPLESILNLS